MCSITSEPRSECQRDALQHYTNGINIDYLLEYVGFNDKGRLHDPRQMKAVLDAVRQKLKKKSLTIVVFVHGWHHSAAEEDTNIDVFSKVLASLSRSENCFSTASGIRSPCTILTSLRPSRPHSLNGASSGVDFGTAYRLGVLHFHVSLCMPQGTRNAA